MYFKDFHANTLKYYYPSAWSILQHIFYNHLSSLLDEKKSIIINTQIIIDNYKLYLLSYAIYFSFITILFLILDEMHISLGILWIFIWINK